MNAMIKSHRAHKSLFAAIASILACFAMVMTLIPAQSIAAESVDYTPISIPTDDNNLIYLAKEQELFRVNKDEIYVTVNDESLVKKVEEGKEQIFYATNVGNYSFVLAPRDGYCWEGGGRQSVDRVFKIVPAEIDKATIINCPTAVVFTGDLAKPKVVIKSGTTTLVENTDYKLTYKDNDAFGNTATVYIEGIKNYTGFTHRSFKLVERQAVYRVYNKNSGEHLFTTSATERDKLVSIGWKDENVGWYAPVTSALPVYRLYNPFSGDHHYTMDKAEYDKLGTIGWRQEGIVFYSDEEQNTPIYRLFNPYAKIGTHHYTMDKNEYDTLPRLGWTGENVGWYGIKAS